MSNIFKNQSDDKILIDLCICLICLFYPIIQMRLNEIHFYRLQLYRIFIFVVIKFKKLYNRYYYVTVLTVLLRLISNCPMRDNIIN